MIRVYCDSNVFRLLKPTSRQFNQSVFDYFENIRKNAVVVFSEAHLDDLHPSIEHYRNEDLELMEKYTNDIFIQYNHSTKTWDCFRATPKMAYDERNFSALDETMKNPFDFRSMVADLGDFPGKELICQMMDNYMSIPISVMGHAEISDIDIARNKGMLDKMIPGYSPQMSIGSFMGSMMPYLSKLFGDHKEFDDLRKNVTTYINTDDYKYEKWGMDFNEQLEKTPIGKKFTDFLRQLTSANEKQDYWQQFFQAYSLLEVFGITEEKVGGRRKKNNLADLTKDCAHAFNAMSCDYFITNDKGLLVKAQILYHIFQVDKPKIINLNELDQFELAQLNDESTESLIPFLLSLPNAFEGDKTLASYEMKRKFLHYFDLTTKFKDNENLYLLSSGVDGGRYFMYRELLKVCEKVTVLWGKDAHGKGDVEIEELTKAESTTCLRIWNFQDAYTQLMCNESERSFYILITFK